MSYIWIEDSKRDDKEEQRIINQLSLNLKQELLLDANKIILSGSSIFAQNFSKELTQELIPLI